MKRAACLALAFALAPVAAEASSFKALPALEGQATPLKLRVLRYSGGTNGELAVEVQNPTDQSQTFVARGLYFVPEGDPDKAPQRLGAAGPFEWQDAQQKAHSGSELKLRPKQTLRLKLQVFCIDSHRASPTAEHSFRLGSARLPRELAQDIDRKAKEAVTRNRGDFKAAPAKSEIQQEVWSTRNKKWVPLEGERKNERPAPSKTHPVRHQRITE
ncbi:MAG: hypothetical protein IT371_09535 [Deltaproteobacteria bacterium]|nr:hypothetical protein [Deltaproteobacteria bacterium]